MLNIALDLCITCHLFFTGLLKMLNRSQINVKMVQALTILSALQLFSEAQKPDMPPCSFGKGVLRYERLSDVQLMQTSSDTDIVRLREIPADVIFKCQDFCLKDKNGQNIPQACGSLDFLPGERYSSQIEYTESKCFLSKPEETPGKPPQYKKANDYYHYREVCYAGDETEKPRVATDCPERLYVMERVMGKRFLPKGASEVNANSLEECQQICLNQATEDPLMATSICRAGSFDHRRARCYLSTYTRRTHPHNYEDDTIYDYFENTCLDVERRCPEGKLFWTKEVNTEMVGPYDSILYQNISLKECREKCLMNSNIFCRSVEYDVSSKLCVLSDEDSISRPDKIRPSLSDQNLYLELTCIDGENVEPENALSSSGASNRDRQPLTDRNLRNVETAFELYRNKRLELSPGFREQNREGTRVTLAECLDACLEERSFQCRSAIYSHSLKSCRLSEFDRINGDLVNDLEYDYFENMMNGFLNANGLSGSRNPGFSNDQGRFRPINFDANNRFDRFGGGASGGSGFAGGSGFTGGNQFVGSSSGGGFSSFIGSNNFGSSENRFVGGDRFGGSLGVSDSSRNNLLNRFGSREDRFENAFNRFSADNLNRGTAGFSSDRFGSTQDRFGNRDTNRLNTLNRDRFAAAGGDRFNRDRFNIALSGGSGTRLSSSGSIGGSRGTNRVTGFDRFSGGSSFSSGADLGSLRGGSASGFAGGNRFGSDTFRDPGASFGFGASSGGGSAFGASGFDSGFGRPSFVDTSGSGIVDELFQVSQQCNPDGSMEFMLRTAEQFRGRIYTFGYYDKCFYRGGGSTVNVLKISPPRGFPECGTTRYGDTTTNIVVVQFADGVMTLRDKKYNLTCTTVGPGDTVVTSAYIGAGMGVPIPIEYIPEVSKLDSQVRLQILHRSRPTTTVAVGDPLTFRIESMAGRGLISDIFATDVIARDLLTGRAIELIDSRGCPVQEEIFSALGKARTGDGLETRFRAFKIPESNMIVFEARVRMCRRECEPAICNVGRGRSEVYSFGKKRRRRNAENETLEPHSLEKREGSNETSIPLPHPEEEEEEEMEYYPEEEDDSGKFDEEEAQVNEVIRVYLNEDEAQEHRSIEASELSDGVCISPSEYYSLLAGLMVTALCLLASLFVMTLCYRKHKKLEEKNAVADESNPRQTARSSFPGPHARTVNQPARYFPSMDSKGPSNFDLNGRQDRSNRFSDPSEPIYTDPTLFERSPKAEGSSEKL